MQALIPTRALVDGALREGVAVLIDGASIAGVAPADAIPAGAEPRRLDGTLAPGFIDTQVNGGGGV
ncbi:N-acetylglucosamine-6-phosphate deacetylase, partial [Escherichia coli]|nr:N-acetylglucosamine-6-phosphate deacetylase [Escherichia coli]